VIYPPDIVHFFSLASQPCFSDYDYIKKNPQAWLGSPDFLSTASFEQTITLLTFCNCANASNEGFRKPALEKRHRPKYPAPAESVAGRNGVNRMAPALPDHWND